eukprot:TRINITY_DN3179_c0_g2_i4.p2 TRINITY_DN3179_c0_g2~~TRINITY_DN3179_c0_g2_i4.p2  ORF type:complete len:251 (-),score=13.07 TRINITY_DN3179_c0_g2_i4:211-963(-)
MMQVFLLVGLLIVKTIQIPSTGYDPPLELKLQSKISLPYEYQDNEARHCFYRKTAKSIAYVAEDKLIYTVGNTSLLQVVDIANVSDPQIVGGEYLYLGDTTQYSNKRRGYDDVELSAALWLGSESSIKILVLERTIQKQVKLYITDFSLATNVFGKGSQDIYFWEELYAKNQSAFGEEVIPIQKTLLLDSQQVKDWDTNNISYNQSGVGIVNDCTIILGEDNEFGVNNTGPSTATVIRMQQCISDLLSSN